MSCAYIIPFLLLLLVCINLNIYSINNLFITAGGSKLFKFTLVLFFFNLAGIPPLPGFFLKINFLINLYNKFNSITVVAIIVFINFLLFYFYLNSIKTSTSASYLIFWDISRKNKYSLLLLLMFLLSFSFFWPLTLV